MLPPSSPTIVTLLLATQCHALSPRSWAPWSSEHTNCLTDTEALSIASRYLALYNSGAVTSLYARSVPLPPSLPSPIPLSPLPFSPTNNFPRTNVTSIVTPTFTSYDETGTGPYSDGPATAGAQAFYDSLTSSAGPSSFGNATQEVLFAVHDCENVAYRWVFRAWSTGFNA
jgi:hypothetical protein